MPAVNTESFIEMVEQINQEAKRKNAPSVCRFLCNHNCPGFEDQMEEQARKLVAMSDACLERGADRAVYYVPTKGPEEFIKHPEVLKMAQQLNEEGGTRRMMEMARSI